MHDSMPVTDVMMGRCLGRARHWRVPGNWAKAQWAEEISAEAELAAVAFTPKNAVELPVQTRQQSVIQNHLLQRYRQEWCFNRHCGGQVIAEPVAAPVQSQRDSNAARIQQALAALPASDRELITQLYWEKQTETQIALEAGVSVPAICKRRQRILQRLSGLLKNIRDEG